MTTDTKHGKIHMLAMNILLMHNCLCNRTTSNEEPQAGRCINLEMEIPFHTDKPYLCQDHKMETSLHCLCQSLALLCCSVAESISKTNNLKQVPHDLPLPLVHHTTSNEYCLIQYVCSRENDNHIGWVFTKQTN